MCGDYALLFAGDTANVDEKRELGENVRVIMMLKEKNYEEGKGSFGVCICGRGVGVVHCWS